MIFLVGFVVEFSLAFQCKTLPVDKFRVFLVGRPYIKTGESHTVRAVFTAVRALSVFFLLGVVQKKNKNKYALCGGTHRKPLFVTV